LGIPDLDRRNIGPVLGQLLVFIAVKGGGKSWFLVHCGKRGLLHGAKVLHVTLEMPEDQVAERYMQSLFSVTKRREKYDRTAFELDDLDRLRGFEFRTINPDMAMTDDDIRSKLAARIN